MQICEIATSTINDQGNKALESLPGKHICYTVNRENFVFKIFHVVFFRMGKFSSFIVLMKFLHCHCNYRVFNFRFFCV